jgi:hypothetical protein
VDAGSADSDEESEPLVQPAKQRRISSPLSACHDYLPTVSASAARSSTDSPPRHMATRQGVDKEGDKGANSCFIQPSHKKDGKEPV